MSQKSQTLAVFLVSPSDVGRSGLATPGRSFHDRPAGHNNVESYLSFPLPVTSSMILGSGIMLANNSFIRRLNLCIFI